MTILKDVSLCSIVRDEMMNPAGGIERFVDSHVPYVEEAVIVDTGSVDGTREKLEELQGKYSNLKIFDVPFKNYSHARNKSLEFVKTKQALILDADELLCHEKPQNDWEIINNYLVTYPANVYSFAFEKVNPDEENCEETDTHFERLFEKGDNHFVFLLGEELFFCGEKIFISSKDMTIKHFVPSRTARDKKRENWYLLDDKLHMSHTRLDLWKNNSPSQVDGFQLWKEFNPKRNNYV